MPFYPPGLILEIFFNPSRFLVNAEVSEGLVQELEGGGGVL